MLVKLKTFKSGEGDCVFFMLIDDEHDERYNIMIDCGVFEKNIENFIVDELQRRIDILIVTHVDEDHVVGVTNMLQKINGLYVGKILFNCFQQQVESNDELSEREIEKIEKFATNLPPVVDENFHKVNVLQAACLSRIILKNDTLKQVWNKDYVTDQSADILLGEDPKWGTLKFISPSEERLKKLYEKDFQKAFTDKMHHRAPEQGFKNQEEVYEILMRLADMYEDPKKSVKAASNILSEASFEQAAIEDAVERNLSNANWASIAFVWEYKSRRILFMGDAASSQIEKTLKRIYGEEPQIFDAIKVSHHGSKDSTSCSLMKYIDAPVFFITGGRKNLRPSEETLAKFFFKPLPKELTGRRIDYNFENRILKELCSENFASLRSSKKVTFITDNELEFEYR